MDINNYSRCIVINFISIYWMFILYLVMCRGFGNVVIKDKFCFDGVFSLVEGIED